ncbi:MAG: LPS export ABC transporter periplasmic protein LptC [Bacteroidetes bacterium]|jgi:LPS export ABC transporter protein LptC|nr:LPS export ABC transporter periplasmic protein LptC [Bacteroidota bacterium]
MKEMKIKGVVWIFLILCFGCERNEELIPFTEKDLKLEKTKGVEILYSDSSIVRIRIKAPALVFHLQASDPFQEFPDGIHIDFFNPQGKITSTLTADYAARFQSKKKTFLKNNVRWESINKEVMESPELTWNEETQNLYTNKFVVIATPKDTVFSQGFNADQSFNQIQMRAIDGSMEVKNKSKDGF